MVTDLAGLCILTAGAVGIWAFTGPFLCAISSAELLFQATRILRNMRDDPDAQDKTSGSTTSTKYVFWHQHMGAFLVSPFRTVFICNFLRPEPKLSLRALHTHTLWTSVVVCSALWGNASLWFSIAWVYRGSCITSHVTRHTSHRRVGPPCTYFEIATCSFLSCSRAHSVSGYSTLPLLYPPWLVVAVALC